MEEDLKRLQNELAKTKDTKSKAEADAKAQRVTVMSLKTEVQLVRNVLKRRETELGDIKGMFMIKNNNKRCYQRRFSVNADLFLLQIFNCWDMLKKLIGNEPCVCVCY